MESCVFIGTHSAVLDEKARMVLPAGFRKDNQPEVLNGDFYITPHRDGFLVVRPACIWENYKNLILADGGIDGVRKRKFIRLLCNNSAKIKLDSQHRIVLSQGLRQKLEFADDEPRQKIVVVGCGDFLEIWPEAVYRGEDDSTLELSNFIDSFDGR
jgi:division/cell wall cluster transcriptional repressor MraZ